MTKKKTPTPLKKVETKKIPDKKKIVGPKPTAEWVSNLKTLNTRMPPYMEAFIKKYGGRSPLEGSIYDPPPPAGETRVSELEAENYTLKQQLSYIQNRDMPKEQFKQFIEEANCLVGVQSTSPKSSMLDQFHDAMDGQLSRQYNALNTLAMISDRLQMTKEEMQGKTSAPSPEPHDISTRFSNLIGYASYQNDRLEQLVDKLSKLI